MTDNQQTISADYKSPTGGAHAFSYPQSAGLLNATSQDNARFFIDLRKGLLQMQADVNAFLTEKMEEDKTSAYAAAARVDEEKEEANYGEEVEEEE